jgi:hypothetical protein
MDNPGPDPVTMLILGGGCAALIEVAEVIVWSNDRRQARLRPSPYAGWPMTSFRRSAGAIRNP